jgi:LacI family transcriptional regulator
MGKVDIRELAKELQLSPSTVSRSLRDSHEISEATKKRVKELAAKWNYEPHPYASSLRKSNSKTIGVIVPEVANTFFSQVFNGIDEKAQDNNYHALIYLTHESYEKEVNIITHLQRGRVDGVIMSLSAKTRNFDHITALMDAGIPVVFFDRVAEDLPTTKVTTDDFDSGFKATEHLIRQGCKRIAHLTTTLYLSTTKHRKEGYLAACKKYNLPIEDSLILECNEEDANTKLAELLISDQKPDGIFTAVERLSLKPYETCKAMGIQIPRQLKLVGFSNMDAASILSPSLTTITQPAFEIGKEVAGILLNGLEKKKRKIANNTVIVPSKIIVRESSMK